MSVATTTTTTPRQPRRTAFLVGINYINTQSELNGCYNDVVNVSQYLRSTLGYSSDAIIILTDGNRNSAVGNCIGSRANPQKYYRRFNRPRRGDGCRR